MIRSPRGGGTPAIAMLCRDHECEINARSPHGSSGPVTGGRCMSSSGDFCIVEYFYVLDTELHWAAIFQENVILSIHTRVAEWAIIISHGTIGADRSSNDVGDI